MVQDTSKQIFLVAIRLVLDLFRLTNNLEIRLESLDSFIQQQKKAQAGLFLLACTVKIISYY